MRSRESFYKQLENDHVILSKKIYSPCNDSITKLIWGPSTGEIPYCIGTSNQSICVIPVSINKELPPISILQCGSDIDDILYHTNSKKIISGQSDGKIKLWDVETNLLLQDVKAPRDEGIKCIYCDNQTSDINLIICGNNKGDILLIDPRQKRSVVKEFDVHKDSILDLSCIDNTVMSGCKDGTCCLIDLRKANNNKQDLRQHRSAVTIVVKNRIDKKFISGSKDGTVRLWNLSGQNYKTLKSQTQKLVVTSLVCNNINGIPYSYYDHNPHSGSSILVGYNDSVIRQWSLASSPSKSPICYKVNSVSISSLISYENYIAAGTANGELKCIFIFIYSI